MTCAAVWGFDARGKYATLSAGTDRDCVNPTGVLAQPTSARHVAAANQLRINGSERRNTGVARSCDGWSNIWRVQINLPGRKQMTQAKNLSRIRVRARVIADVLEQFCGVFVVGQLSFGALLASRVCKGAHSTN